MLLRAFLFARAWTHVKLQRNSYCNFVGRVGLRDMLRKFFAFASNKVHFKLQIKEFLKSMGLEPAWRFVWVGSPTLAL